MLKKPKLAAARQAGPMRLIGVPAADNSEHFEKSPCVRYCLLRSVML